MGRDGRAVPCRVKGRVEGRCVTITAPNGSDLVKSGWENQPEGRMSLVMIPDDDEDPDVPWKGADS